MLTYVKRKIVGFRLINMAQKYTFYFKPELYVIGVSVRREIKTPPVNGIHDLL